MSAPYSYSLCREAIEDAVKRGERKAHVCRTLNISRNTLGLQKGNRNKITDWPRF